MLSMLIACVEKFAIKIVVLSDKTTITEKRRLGLTVRDVILLSLGLLLLLLMSLGTLLVWRRKSKRQPM